MILKFNENQLKDLKRTDIMEFFSIFRDLILFVYENEVQSKSTAVLKPGENIRKVLDYLDLNVELFFLEFCLKLLKVSSQIQQKFLGIYIYFFLSLGCCLIFVTVTITLITIIVFTYLSLFFCSC